MIIDIDGRKYSFKFYHENPQIKESSKKLLDSPLERATTCIVFNEDGTEVARGTANVHPKDNFCKETGRQVALARAISSWDKPYKTKVWMTYRNWGKKRW